MTPFTFDIETIPGQRPGLREEMAANIRPPAQYKKPDSIAQWLAENREAEAEQAWLKTALDGGLGQVCVIGYAFGDDEPRALVAPDLSIATERELLKEFFGALTVETASATFVGHNVIGFDFRFIWQRAMVLGVCPPIYFPRDPKPWGGRVFDTMLAWAGPREYISMDRLCSIFDIPGKAGMDGSQVWPAVRDGRIGDVVTYCAGDVGRARALYRRMSFADRELAEICAQQHERLNG